MLNFILGIIIGGMGVWLLLKFVFVNKNEKEKAKAKILALLSEKERVSNDEIQQMLKIGDSTITRYCDELEKEGNIRQIGQTGKAVYYERVK